MIKRTDLIPLLNREFSMHQSKNHSNCTLQTICYRKLVIFQSHSLLFFGNVMVGSFCCLYLFTLMLTCDIRHTKLYAQRSVGSGREGRLTSSKSADHPTWAIPNTSLLISTFPEQFDTGRCPCGNNCAGQHI